MRKIKIAGKVQNMPPSGIRKFFDLVLGMPEVISLGVGEPDFVTPWVISESGINSVEEGYTSYTSNKGLYKLRLLISKHIKEKYKVSYDPNEEILITVGVSEAVDLALRTLIEPGDRVIVPMPSYVSYGPVSSLAGAEVDYLDTSKTGFKIRPKDLEKVITKDTRALILNYPSNPTGVSYRKKDLEAIQKICWRNNTLVLSDEIYDTLTYDYEHVPFITLKNGKKNTVYLNGFSKGYAMTGWRVGYACGPREVIAAMTKIHQYTIMCVPTMSQFAACEALVSGEKPLEDMKKEYQRRRELVVDGFNKMKLKCIKPDGAFYCFPSIKRTGLDSLTFAEKLLKEKQVAVVPGTAFGPMGKDYVRISYATATEKLVEALKRIEDFVKKCKK